MTEQQRNEPQVPDEGQPGLGKDHALPALSPQSPDGEPTAGPGTVPDRLLTEEAPSPGPASSSSPEPGSPGPGSQEPNSPAPITGLPSGPAGKLQAPYAPASAARPSHPASSMHEDRPEEDLPAEELPARSPGGAAANAAVLAESRRHTRRSFVVGGAAAAAAFGFYKWLDLQPGDQMQPRLLRRAYEANAALSQETGRDLVLTPTYPLHQAETLRVNGVYGLKRELFADSWRLQLVGVKDASQHPRFVQDVTAWEYRYTARHSGEDQGHDTKVDPKVTGRLTADDMLAPAADSGQEEDDNHTGRKPRGMEEAGESDSTLRPGTPGLLLTMADVLKLPRHELVTQFKCIEGWSQIVHWAGIRLADFLEAYPPERVHGAEPKYVYMETPDGDYYTGYDLAVCRHPQALLVTEMMGAPLTQFHGAPLRLHMPTKYGYKQIKRIGLISYTDDKPDDYWTKLGYDWYAGL